MGALCDSASPVATWGGVLPQYPTIGNTQRDENAAARIGNVIITACSELHSPAPAVVPTNRARNSRKNQ